MNRLIVTDSTSDLSGSMLKGLDVRIIPVNILLDGQNYKDRVQVKIKEFYDNFDRFKTMKTAPVSVEEYAYVYHKLTAGYDEIIFIHCSKHLSKTWEHAVKVHQQAGSGHNCRVAVIDSRHCGMGLGLIVLEAAQAMKDG